MSATKKKLAIDARLAAVLWQAKNYGQLETLAGVTDRNEFWRGKTLEQARAELHRLVRERVERGEL